MLEDKQCIYKWQIEVASSNQNRALTSLQTLSSCLEKRFIPKTYFMTSITR